MNTPFEAMVLEFTLDALHDVMPFEAMIFSLLWMDCVTSCDIYTVKFSNYFEQTIFCT